MKGKAITMTEVDPNKIAPSQDFLKEGTVNFILQCVKDGDYEQLPPNPIVRRDTEGKLVAIDGHNLLAVRAFYGQKQQVHIAESAEDGLIENSDADRLRNQDLRDKFESCLAARESVSSRGIDTFNDLISKYPQLFGDR